MLTVVRQRHPGDCGVAALATLLSARIGYEDVYLAAARVDPKLKGKGGLQNGELLRLARSLGLQLQPVRKFNLDRDEGLLRIRSDHHHSEGHWVAVRWGIVLDPFDGFLAPWLSWVARYDARLATLLRGELG